jgi:hypothetical protein
VLRQRNNPCVIPFVDPGGKDYTGVYVGDEDTSLFVWSDALREASGVEDYEDTRIPSEE